MAEKAYYTIHVQGQGGVGDAYGASAALARFREYVRAYPHLRIALYKGQKLMKASTPRKSNPTISSSKLPIGEWSPAHAIRQNADGSIDILREKNSGRRANISEGFYAGGVFHPIRAAADYDESRVGEKRVGRKTTKKKVAHKDTYAARVKKLAKSHPYKLHHKQRGFVKGFATKEARDNEYKRRGGAKKGYVKK